MNAASAHAHAHGSVKTPVFRPGTCIIDADTHGNRGFNTQRDNLDAPGMPGPVGDTGLRAANDEIVRLTRSPASPEFPNIQAAGYKVVTWTVNDALRMLELLQLGVDGMISTGPICSTRRSPRRPERRRHAGRSAHARRAHRRQEVRRPGHRGGRNAGRRTRSRRTVGLDNLMTTLEMDWRARSTTCRSCTTTAISRDAPGEPKKSRRKLGGPLPVHIRDATLADIQDAADPILSDGIIRDPATQQNDPGLSPVCAFWASRGGPSSDIYMMASLDDVFAFVDFIQYYKSGAGVSDPRATLRWKNATRVRFNIETKLNPREPGTTKTPASS